MSACIYQKLLRKSRNSSVKVAGSKTKIATRYFRLPLTATLRDVRHKKSYYKQLNDVTHITWMLIQSATIRRTHVVCQMEHVVRCKLHRDVECPNNVKYIELVQYNTINFKKFPEFTGVIYRNRCMRKRNVLRHPSSP